MRNIKSKSEEKGPAFRGSYPIFAISSRQGRSGMIEDVQFVKLSGGDPHDAMECEMNFGRVILVFKSCSPPLSDRHALLTG
jgi:hypothetical protein